MACREIYDAPEDVISETAVDATDHATASQDSAAQHSAANTLSSNSVAMKSREASMSSYQLKR
jgi:hypothetical protein